MDPISARMVMAAAGSGAAEGLYVEDVFSTSLYEGIDVDNNGPTITNGLDLAGEGGFVWLKARTVSQSHAILSSDSNFQGYLIPNSTAARAGSSTQYVTPNSDGFTFNFGGSFFNDGGQNYAAWCFRKAPGFLDIVTWTGDDNSPRTISHSLGSTPGFIIVKKYSEVFSWYCYHRSLGATKTIALNTTSTALTSSNFWNDTEPTSSEFTVQFNFNETGKQYVAYIFAHDDARFGPNGDEGIIKCGSYIGNGSLTGPIIDLGWEPQWVLIKNAEDARDWYLFDTARVIAYDENDSPLIPNGTAAEATTTKYLDLSSTGFQIKTTLTGLNGNGYEFVYMAIRRPDKAPEAGTDFFQVRARTGSSTSSPVTSTIDFQAADTLLTKNRSGQHWNMTTRGFPDFGRVSTSRTVALGVNTTLARIAGDEDYTVDFGTDITVNAASDYVDYIFKRARGAFDTVFYEGATTAQAIDHGLGDVPKMMWVKVTNINDNWAVYHEGLGNGKALYIDNTAATTSANYWNNTSPTSTQFTVGTSSITGQSGNKYVAYLFGNIPGVIDIGSYTGNSVDGREIDCGFTAGARFVLIKGTGFGGSEWIVVDTARGIGSPSPRLELNNEDQEVVSDFNVAPYSAGFEVSNNVLVNSSGNTYIYMAIA